jgi:hypothetical protein
MYLYHNYEPKIRQIYKLKNNNNNNNNFLKTNQLLKPHKAT